MVEVIKTIPCAAAKGLELALMAVAISGTVEMSNLPASFGVKVGDPVSMSFFTLPAPVDRRSADDPKFRLQDGIGLYPLCNETFSLKVGPMTGSIGAYVAPLFEVPPWMQEATFFALASKRPTLDNIFLSPAGVEAKPLPLVMKGTRGLYPPQFELSFNLVYNRGTIPGIHMKQAAAKEYTAEGLVKSTITLATSYFPSNTAVSIKLSSISMDDGTKTLVQQLDA